MIMKYTFPGLLLRAYCADISKPRLVEEHSLGCRFGPGRHPGAHVWAGGSGGSQFPWELVCHGLDNPYASAQVLGLILELCVQATVWVF